MMSIHRRDLIKGAGATALATDLGAPALAQSGGKVVVGTWGGDYARLLTKNIEDPILKPKGIEVVQPLDAIDIGMRKAGLDANPGWLAWLGKRLDFVFGEPREPETW